MGLRQLPKSGRVPVSQCLSSDTLRGLCTDFIFTTNTSHRHFGLILADMAASLRLKCTNPVRATMTDSHGLKQSSTRL